MTDYLLTMTNVGEDINIQISDDVDIQEIKALCVSIINYMFQNEINVVDIFDTLSIETKEVLIHVLDTLVTLDKIIENCNDEKELN